MKDMHYHKQLLSGTSGTWLMTVALLFLLLSGAKTEAQSLIIENEVLKVVVEKDDGSISVVDKRINYTYRQTVEETTTKLTDDEEIWRQTEYFGDRRQNLKRTNQTVEAVKVLSVEKITDNQIKLLLKGNKLESCLLELKDTEKPTLFMTLTNDGSTDVTKTGFPKPFMNEKENGYLLQSTQGDGILLPLTELNKAKGDPFSMTGSLPLYGITDMKKGYIAALETFQHSFNQTHYAVYPKKIRFHFVTEGGYVALAKYYRKMIQERGNLITLKEKAEHTPHLYDIIGAPVVYLWGHARSYEFCKRLKEAGIDRALIMMNLRTEVWPDKDMIDKTRRLGFVVGRYVVRNTTEQAPVRFDLNGKQLPGVNPPKGSDPLELIKEDLKERPFQSRFYDTFIAAGFRGDEKEAKKYIDFFHSTWKETGQLSWSGEGYTPDWAFPGLHGLEGCMTMRGYISGYMNNPGRKPNGSADWNNRFTPFACVGEVDPDDSFREWEVNPKYRIPLLGLVYHDCIMTTWNWRGANHRIRGGWEQKDLMNILFGNKPMWNLDVTLWEKDEETREKLIDSYKKFSEVLKAVELEEMTNHTWLNDEKDVAMVSYANGVQVAVNFRNEPFTFGDKTIAPLSYLMWKN